MSPPLTLRVALTRGAIVTLGNWPVVLVDFVVESVYKFTLGVPVVGAAFMVAVLQGIDIRTLLGDGLLSAVEHMLLPLLDAPATLLAFFAALAVVGVGGAVVMFVVKSGALAVLVAGERLAGEPTRRPLTLEAVRAARAFSLAALWEAIRRFQSRAAALAAGLGVAHLALGSLYLVVVVDGFRWVADTAWAPAWPLLVFVATSAVVVALTAVNLFFDLARVVMITDDCGVRAALDRVRAFLLADARHVLGVFGVMGGVVLLASAAAFTATAGLTLVAWVPVLGLLFVPLQMAFWVVRGVLFQSMNLTTLSAYQSQYRRFSSAGPAPIRLRVQEA